MIRGRDKITTCVDGEHSAIEMLPAPMVFSTAFGFMPRNHVSGGRHVVILSVGSNSASEDSFHGLQ